MSNFCEFSHPTVGGIGMDSQNLWQLFIETGAPEMYLLYSKARKQELTNAFESSGISRQNNTL